jgi:hypothetical protein
MAIAEIGARHRPCLERLLGLASGEDLPQRRLAIRILAELRHPLASALESLPRNLLEDADSDTRSVLLRLLGKSMASVPEKLRAATAGLADADARVRCAALDVVASLKGKAGGAASAVLELLARDRNSEVRYQAGRTLARISAQQHQLIPRLTDLLDHVDEEVVESCAWALHAMGRAAQAALPKLIVVGRSQSTAGTAAKEAVIRIGGADLFTSEFLVGS